MTTAYAPIDFALPSLHLVTDVEIGPMIRFVTETELVKELSSIRGARIVTIQTRTEPRMLAKHPATGQPNPYRDNVVKVSRVNGMIGWQYARCVNRQREREGKATDFESLPRAWGQRISGSPFVEHKGSTYLELKVERCLGYQYELLDGRALDSGEIAPYLPTGSPGRQGVEREIILRDYALRSIETIKFGGVTFVLRRGEENESNHLNSAEEMAGAA